MIGIYYERDVNFMNKIKAFLKKKDVVFSLQRYGIDALGAMAQGLFCTLLVGTILNTIGQQFAIAFLNKVIVSIGQGDGAVHYTIGGLASAMVGPGIAVAIGAALHCPNLVLFSLIPVGFAANAMGGAGGPLAVFFVTIVAAECGKLVSKETRVDILVTPIVTVLVGIGIASVIAEPIGTAAKSVGIAIGNILGSNICNILLILGLSAMIAVLPIQKDSLKVDLPVVLGASVLFLIFGMTEKEINRIEGLILTAILISYTTFLIVGALKNRGKEGGMAEVNDNAPSAEEEESKGGFDAWYDKMKAFTWFLAVATIVGLGIVVGGAMMAVEGAKTIAGELGVSENIIGLTVVAIGTSLPELITSVMAAKKGETDIAVGNIVGSNIFNILMVGGLSSIIYPLPFAPKGVSFLPDGIIALSAVVLLAVFSYSRGNKLKKWHGAVFFIGAIAYYVYTVLCATGVIVF
jgi:K+-dependent Na+/Ca+ exchanger-like protein